MHAAVIGLLLSAFAGRSADFTVEDFKQTRLEAEKGDSEAQVALGRMFVTVQVLREDNGADGCTQTELAGGLSRLQTS